MQYVTDLHLHSKYARAVSKDMILPNMAAVAKQKGLDLLTAADWTHPLWFKEIRMQLTEVGEGIYRLRSDDGEKPTLFLLSTEISSIFTWKGKLRRIHNLVFVPDFSVAEAVSRELMQRNCNLSSDGRPIIGLSSKALLELILAIDERCMLIPCHVWTPHFGLYGSASGFDSLEESFEDLAGYIYGIETGLSSDPEMNWRIEELQNRSIVSFSDAHSLPKMGREATVMELSVPSYTSVRTAFMRKGGAENKVVYTVEFYPEEGKYHFSGHRNCKVVFGPEEIKTQGNTCPVCHRRLTEGVLYRVQELASQDTSEVIEVKHNAEGLKWYTDKTHHHPPYVKLVPLLEVVAEAMDSTVASKKVKEQYETLCRELESEMHILLKASVSEIEKVAGARIAEAVEKVRRGTIAINPGFDGEYGKVQIWSEHDEAKEEAVPQLSLDI